MSLTAPVRVPVELSGGARWFRLAHAVGVDGLTLGQAAPEELEGTFEARFRLPGDLQPIRVRARAAEVVVGEGEQERGERRALVFLDLDPASRARIEGYIQERLGLLS